MTDLDAANNKFIISACLDSNMCLLGSIFSLECCRESKWWKLKTLSRLSIEFKLLFYFENWASEIVQQTVWPSGLRRHVQVVVSPGAWVRIPQLSYLLVNKFCEKLKRSMKDERFYVTNFKLKSPNDSFLQSHYKSAALQHTGNHQISDE